MKRILLILKEKWPEYILEILVLIIGIYGAFALDSWNEERKSDKIQNSLLMALREDLAQDTIIISQLLPEVEMQLELNEKARKRMANIHATADTLVKIMRYEYDPSWRDQLLYNTNAYSSLHQTGIIENLSQPLKSAIKNFYNRRSYLISKTGINVNDYRDRVKVHVDRYTFGSLPIHDQGQFIDNQVWRHIDLQHLAASFNSLSNYKRILYSSLREELNYSLVQSRMLIYLINQELE